MTENTNSEKPGWFELIDGNAPSAQVQRVNKVLPAVAVLVTGAIIATGAFFANASDQVASQVVATTSDSTQGGDIAPVANESAVPAVTNPADVAPANPAAPGMLPPGGGDDEDHEWGEEDEDDDDHENRPPRRGHHDEEHEDEEEDD